MERCYLDDIAQNVLDYLQKNYPSVIQPTSGVPIVTHIRNCQKLLKEFGWSDHFHWHPMLELCRLERLDEEETWTKFVGPYKDQDYAKHQRESFGRFFKRCCYMAKRDLFQCPEKFYYLAGSCQKETWGIMMTDVLAVTDELKEAGKDEKALAFLRQTAPLYLTKVHWFIYTPPPEHEPSDEEWNEARSVLSLTKEEEERIYYWDADFRFDQECENAPKSGWRKRWRDLGGKDFWEVLI